jgi:hypothetical protein
MRRVARHRPEPGNLDSFLDIMTNVVGVLVFVLLFVTLAAADATVLVRTPLRSETDKQPIYFEAAAGHVIYVESPRGNEEVDSFLTGLPRISWYNLSYVLDRVDAFSAQTPNYTIDFTGSPLARGMGVRWRVRPGAGERVKVVKDTASAYQHVLRTLDPDTAYLAFIVRPDGLEAFRAARDVATRHGLSSGWEPFEYERDLVFGSSGRQVGVQ